MMSPDEILRQRPMAAPTPARRYAEPKAGVVRRIDPERAFGVVDPDKFTCEEVYKVFLALTFDWSPADRETTWFDIRTRVVPDKPYQFRYTESDWRKIYAAFTGRKEKCSNVRMGTNQLTSNPTEKLNLTPIG